MGYLFKLGNVFPIFGGINPKISPLIPLQGAGSVYPALPKAAPNSSLGENKDEPQCAGNTFPASQSPIPHGTATIYSNIFLRKLGIWFF